MQNARVLNTSYLMHPTKREATRLRLDYTESQITYCASFRVNSVNATCAENVALNKLRNSWDESTNTTDYEMVFAAKNDCWDLVVQTRKHWLSIALAHPPQGTVPVYFQVLTKDASLKIERIDMPCIPDPSRAPVDNTLPHLPVFSTGQVVRQENLERSAVFKVSVSTASGINNVELAVAPSGPDGARVCVEKSIDYMTSTMMQELSTLARMKGAHPNVVRLVGLISPEGEPDKVCGMLLSYLPGVSLSNVRSVTREQKDKWVAQLESAINWLHGQSIVWGDAKAENIIIHGITDDLVLFDFDGGHTREWVSPSNAGKIDGDKEGQAAIEQFIHELPLDPPAR